MFSKFPITEKMHIHSLNGELREATILKRLDDKYGVIRDKLLGRDER